MSQGKYMTLKGTKISPKPMLTQKGSTNPPY